MCTVSWQHGAELERAELLLYFNRDERRARSKARAPEVFTENGVNYIAPTDSARGGTWIAANEFGCAVCLLNDYSVDLSAVDTFIFESRGALVRQVAILTSVGEVENLLERGVITYPPFTLLFWDGIKMCRWHWDLEKLTKEEASAPPQTSSSWETERVEAGRTALYHSWVRDEDRSLESYHKHVIPGDSESSVCMARELTQTVSLTSIRITPSKVQMRYTPRDEDGAFLSEFNLSLLRK